VTAAARTARSRTFGPTLRARTRDAWHRWLARHHASAKEIWLVSPRKATGKSRIPYNDAVDEALCFGWIDSTQRSLDAGHTAQRFTPRRPGSPVSAMNLERARRLVASGRMRAAGRRAIGVQLASSRRLVIAPDIARALKAETRAWTNFRRFPASYKRIRVGWVEGARDRPAEFQKRLRYFVAMTAKNKRYGMVQ